MALCSLREIGRLLPLLLLLGLLPARAAVAASPSSPAPAPAAEDEGVPVRLDGEVVLRVRGWLGAFTPEERARAGEARLLRVADDPFYSEDLFSIRAEEGRALIFYRDAPLAVVSAEDARGSGLSPADYAARELAGVRAAVHAYRTRQLPAARLRGLLTAITATALLVLLLNGLSRLHRAAQRRLEASGEGPVADVRRRLGRSLLRLARGLAVAVLVLAYAQTVFAAMPLTRGFARTALLYVLDPLRTLWAGFVANIGDLVFVLVIVVLAYYVLQGLHWLLAEAARGSLALPGVSPQWALPFYKILRMGVVAIAVVMAYPYIPGSSSEAFKGVSLFAGALFTLGASGAAGNFIGGLALVFVDVFRVGDRIRVGEVEGDVVEATLLLTRVRTPKNEVVTLPNSSVVGGSVVNYSAHARQEGLILHTTVTIGYDAPWRQVHELLVRAALRTAQVLRDPAPFVLQRSLGDFYVSYEINAYTRNANAMLDIYGELHQNIQDSFNEAGVEIMSPHYTSLRDGRASTIPGAGRRAGAGRKEAR